MSKKLRQYRLNIISIKNLNRVLSFIIPILITIILSLPNFLSNINSISCIIISAIIVCFLCYIQYTANAIDADNKYLDEDILKFKDICHEYESLKNKIKANDVLWQQVASVLVAVHFSIRYCKDILLKDLDDMNFIISLKAMFEDIYKILQRYYFNYAEKSTLALYIFDKEYNKYFDFISVKPEFSNNEKGRIWDYNDNSHISFVGRSKEREDFVFDDIENQLPKPKNFNENDPLNYTASISIPILYQNGDLRGVLSFTSNEKKRFKQDEYANKIFVDSIFAISQIVEFLINYHFKDQNKEIMEYIIEDYKANRPDELNKIKTIKTI